MNERIKQFYEQCNRVVDDPFGGAHISFDHQMFAELIVRECQTVVEWAISVDSTIDRVPVLIKEHFGVEE
jgi:hypothetical protein